VLSQKIKTTYQEYGGHAGRICCRSTAGTTIQVEDKDEDSETICGGTRKLKGEAPLGQAGKGNRRECVYGTEKDGVTKKKEREKKGDAPLLPYQRARQRRGNAEKWRKAEQE